MAGHGFSAVMLAVVGLDAPVSRVVVAYLAYG